MIKRRRRFKQTTTLEKRIADFASQLRAKANTLPAGVQKNSVVKRIHCAEEALHLNDLLTMAGPNPAEISNRRR